MIDYTPIRQPVPAAPYSEGYLTFPASSTGAHFECPRSAMDTTDKELKILEHIEQNSHVNQRDLASGVGMSLGMTNAVLKRLVTKGLLMMQKVNNRNIKYAVTPQGIEAIAKRSYRYFRRTLKNVAFYREAIESLVQDVKARGFEGIVLVGPSDLDFIVEWACEKWGLGFLSTDEQKGRVYCLYSERYIPEGDDADATGFLQKILLDSELIVNYENR